MSSRLTQMLLVLATVVSSLALSGSASAYTLQSAFTTSCHERMSVVGLGHLEKLYGAELGKVILPENDDWDRLAKSAQPLVDELLPELSERFANEPELRFLFFSLAAGVREPDTLGHATADLNALRRIHADPTDQGQYSHALRGKNDDGLEGDRQAMEGTKQVVLNLMQQVSATSMLPPNAQLSREALYLNYHDSVFFEVLTPVFLLGQALHALQDSHSHSLRSENGDYVLSVLNYIDPLAGTTDPERDGEPHSGDMDNCDLPEVAPLVERAADRSTAMIDAAIEYSRGDDTALVAGLNNCPEGELDRNDCGWFTYNPPCDAALTAGDAQAIDDACCTKSNQYCDSPWAVVAQGKPTSPYLSCSLTTPADSRGGSLVWASLLLGLTALVRRRFWLAGIASLLCALVLAPAPAQAETQLAVDPAQAQGQSPRGWLALEGHFSLLSDMPAESLLKVRLGYGLRGGLRWGAWGGLLHLEQDAWLPVEGQGDGIDPGAFNAGVGGEYFFYKDFLRTSLTLGVSVLLFDSALTDAGNAGIFVDFRPIGLHWTPHHHVALVFDPISITYVAPDLGEDGIRLLQYRTSFSVEWML